jgi:tetratricopeptide (TPR) repeat protein
VRGRGVRRFFLAFLTSERAVVVAVVVVVCGRGRSALVVVAPAKPTDFNSHFQRHLALLALKRGDDALAALGRTLELNGDYVDARIKRAQLQMERSRFDEAESDLQHALSKKPNNTLAKKLLAKLTSARSAAQSADFLKDAEHVPCGELMARLNTAIAGLPATGSPAATPLRLRRARCALAAADHASVLDDTRRVLASDDSNVAALELRGHALAALGEDEAASQHFNQCSRFDPDNEACRWHFKRSRNLHRALQAARVAAQQHQWRDCLTALDDAGAAANDHPDAAVAAATMRARNAQLGAALVAALGTLGAGGGVHAATLVALRCSALAGAGELDAALLVCARAAELDGSAEPFIQRAETLLKLQRYDEAIGDFSRAQQREPQNHRAANGKHQAERAKKVGRRVFSCTFVRRCAECSAHIGARAHR